MQSTLDTVDTVMEPTNRIRALSSNGNGHADSPKTFPLLVAPTPAVEEEISMTGLEEKQELLAHHVRLVARGKSFGLFVAGPGGLGKSKTIAETLAAEGITPVLLNSHVTPLSLYQTLFFNRKDSIIWLDDCDSIYANMMILGLLRSALWGQGERIVTYTSTQLPEGLPRSFPFDSRIVFCANKLPKKNEAFKAVLSRVDCFTLDSTNDELIEQMRLLANRGMNKLTPAQCHEVVDFIEQNAGPRRLSMRLYEPSLRKLEYAMTAGIDWRDLVKSQLEQLGQQDNIPKPVNTQEHDLTCLREALKQFPESVKDQERFWHKATGKSRASFFRVKKAFEKGK
jgi:hypothetical protein